VSVSENWLQAGSYTGLGARPIQHNAIACDHEEGYRLVIAEDAITIEANTFGGVFYALTTLSELDRLNDGQLTCGTIEDHPDMDFRAISDDISRGQVSTFEHFKTIIRRLARYKYNVYMPYIEDVFKLKCCPDWGKYSDGLTCTEWHALTEYAASYHISVRPIINLLGHFDKNAGIKSLQAITIHDDKGTPTSVIDPLNPAVKPLILNILDEVIEAFGPGVIHVGGDEPCSITEVYGKEKGGQLFIDYFTWVHDELAKRDCSMMMYADFFAPPWGDYAVGLERALELPHDVNFVFWDYAPRASYPYVEKLHEIGLTVTVSPGTWAWNRFSCDMKVCWDNTVGLLRAANGNSNYMLMSSWGDGGDCSRELNWPGFLIGANCAWATETNYTFEEFYHIYHAVFLGLNKEEAASLNAVYHYDRVLGLEDNFIFKNEMYKCALEPITFAARDKAHLLIPEMEKAIASIQTLKAKVEENTILDALYLSAKRILFTAKKISYLPATPPTSREEAKAYISDILALACELETVRHYHEKVWFDTNRLSDWNYVDMLYLDLRDELTRLARHMANDKNFNKNLAFHVFQG
ncbi:MAG: glycoside hydrolase family 20 zincin-like fold domain-containing protein, partial [Niameybacter sp.]